MTDHNPLRHARALVLAGPALALLFTVFSLGCGTGARLIGGVWFGGGAVESPHGARVRPVAGVS